MQLPPKDSTIVIAMSGGVDSSAVAGLLVEQGYNCIGVTLRLVPEAEHKSVFEPCCGLEAVHDARRVCDQVGIPHRVLHAVERFDNEIISNFLDEYQRARTPNPCIRCNRFIKFGALYEEADKIGAEYIAMGHFARREMRGDRFSLRRATYRPKDQSYVLSPLRQDQLARALFPLGEMTKAQVREEATRFGFRTAKKAESQELCFVHDRDYARYIEERTQPSLPGVIVNTQGKILGRHKGLIHYTLGQRRGLGIAAPEPYYVIRLDPEKNQVIVGHDNEICCARFTTQEIHWGGMVAQTEPFDVSVQLRSRHNGTPATVRPTEDGAVVELHEPQRSVTPGQWAVFYDEDDYVLASAVIEDAPVTPISA